MKSEIKKAISSIGITAILVIFALTLTLGVASAATLVVNQTDPACTVSPEGLYYGTIQAAVFAASSGDEIIVCPEGGNPYTETVDINVSNVIIRAYDNTKPVVSALNNPNDHVFNITDQTNVTLQGFEIRDARGTTQDVAGIIHV